MAHRVRSLRRFVLPVCLALSAAVASSLVAPEAHACSRTAPIRPGIRLGAMAAQVPRDAGLLFHAELASIDPAAVVTSLDMKVTRDGGTPVPGTLELLSTTPGGDPGAYRAELLFVPEAPLPVGAALTASYANVTDPSVPHPASEPERLEASFTVLDASLAQLDLAAAEIALGAELVVPDESGPKGTCSVGGQLTTCGVPAGPITYALHAKRLRQVEVKTPFPWDAALVQAYVTVTSSVPFANGGTTDHMLRLGASGRTCTTITRAVKGDLVAPLSRELCIDVPVLAPTTAADDAKVQADATHGLTCAEGAPVVGNDPDAPNAGEGAPRASGDAAGGCAVARGGAGGDAKGAGALGVGLGLVAALALSRRAAGARPRRRS